MMYGVVGVILSALTYVGANVFGLEEVLEPVALWCGGVSLFATFALSGDGADGDACGGGCGGGCGGCGG